MQVCFVQRDIPYNNTVIRKNILCAIIDGDSIIGISSLCQSATLFNKYREANISLKFFIDPETQLPLIALDNTDTDSYMDITVIYTMVSDYLKNHQCTTLPDAVSKAIIDKLCSIGYTKTLSAYYVASCLDYWTYQTQGEFTGVINIRPDFYDSELYQFTANFINANNREQTNPFTLISETEDVTKFQNTCTDPLFIRIPLPHEISSDTNFQEFLPKRDEVSKPYGNRELKDMTTYKDIGSPFTQNEFPLIEGRSENNELGVQENEKLYYQSLIDWVKYNMKHEFGDNVDVDLSNPNIDLTSQEYLLELLEMFYIFYWKHNPNVPDINENYDEDSSNIDSKYIFKANDEEKSLYRQGFSEFATNNLHINAIEMLKSFVQKAALSIGYQAYVESIIKLARWGERKCTALSFDNYPIMFMLGTNQEKEKIGNIEDYKVEQQDGCEYTAVCPIYESILLTDSKYFKELGYEKNHLAAPIGVYAKKRLVNMKNGKEIEVNINFSFVDLVKLLKAGKCEIAGFGYEGGQFSAPDIPMDNIMTASKLISMYSESKDDDIVQEHFYRSEELQNLYLEFNALQGNVAIKPNQFTILQGKYTSTNIAGEFSRQKITSKEDFNEKRSSGIIRNSAASTLDTNIASVILPIYVEVSKKYTEGMSLVEVLALYDQVMSDVNYQSEAAFLQASTLAEPPQHKQAETVAKMDMFNEKNAKDTSINQSELGNGVVTDNRSITNSSNGNTAESVTTAPVTPKLSLIKTIPMNATLNQILSRNGELLGGFYLETDTNQRTGKSFKVVTLTSVEMYNACASKGNAHMSLYKLIPSLMYDLCAIEAGKEDLVRVYFDSVDTMNNMLLTVNKLVRAEEL